MMPLSLPPVHGLAGLLFCLMLSLQTVDIYLLHCSAEGTAVAPSGTMIWWALIWRQPPHWQVKTSATAANFIVPMHHCLTYWHHFLQPEAGGGWCQEAGVDRCLEGFLGNRFLIKVVCIKTRKNNLLLIVLS